MDDKDDRVYCVEVSGGLAFRFRADNPKDLADVSEQARAWMNENGFIFDGGVTATVIPRHRN